jgi:hypothetical protein
MKEDRMERHRPLRAAAAAQRRAAARARKISAADLDDRASAIWTVLTADRWHTVTDIMRAVAGCEAFHRPDGRPFPKGHSLRVAVLRELQKAPLKAMIEIDSERREKRGFQVLKVRQKACQMDLPMVALRDSATSQTVTSQKPARKKEGRATCCK